MVQIKTSSLIQTTRNFATKIKFVKQNLYILLSNMFPATLVNYEVPKLVSVRSMEIDIESTEAKAKILDLPESDGSSGDEAEPKVDLLDILLPPRIGRQGKKMWIQKISRTPATSRDVLRLQERIDEELMKQEAKEMGLCPVRRELYNQCFDELIRQETIACPERGHLLRMVRKESEISLKGLSTAYESSLAYGIKKHLDSFAHVAETSAEIADLSVKISELNEEIKELESKEEAMDKVSKAEEAEQLTALKAVEMKLENENQVYLRDMQGMIDISIDL